MILCTGLQLPHANNHAQIAGIHGFVENCIKSCITNVPLKKAKTLLHQRFCLFGVFPNLRLGTLSCIGMYFNFDF